MKRIVSESLDLRPIVLCFDLTHAHQTRNRWQQIHRRHISTVPDANSDKPGMPSLRYPSIFLTHQKQISMTVIISTPPDGDPLPLAFALARMPFKMECEFHF
jgi:hypothetical protein